MSVSEIRVTSLGPEDDPAARALERQAAELGIALEGIRTSRVFYAEDLDPLDTPRIVTQLLSNSNAQQTTVGPRHDWDDPRIVEVAPLPGATHPERASIAYGAQLLGIIGGPFESGVEYHFPASVPVGDIDRIVGTLLVNGNVQQIRRKPPQHLGIEGEVGNIETISVGAMDNDVLVELSKSRKLALNLKEMQAIRAEAQRLGRNLTDGELEYLAGRWSEHCVHKTTNAEIIEAGERRSSIFQRIQDSSRPYFAERGVLSAFRDNSGVWRFYDDQALNVKLETHNSPRMNEPAGGAATGTGGVLRDIVATGKGVRPISSMHMDFIAPPDIDPDLIPPGTLTPAQLINGSVRGVGNYGNPVGVPTNNGSFHTHPDYRGKASILVGSIGILPEQNATQGVPQFGDLVVAVGARTGKDGIHGATFASESADASTATVHSGAVQIGDPIAEKKMFDALLEASEQGLIRAMTDCGAAGFGSAIGELGEDIGVRVDIAQAPLKYTALSPWEIWMSESQERCVLAVDPANRAAVEAIFAKHDSEATVLGSFGTDGNEPKLEVFYDTQQLIDLSYGFIKNGLPVEPLEAQWMAANTPERSPLTDGWQTVVYKVLSHWNVCSKEPIVRRYDHGVQGHSAMPPYAGVHHDAPMDAAVMTPLLGEPYAVVQAHGCNPALTELDPKLGSRWSYVEAMSNFVAAGGNPDDAIIINNYIAGTPTPRIMGALSNSVDALVECVHEFRSPIISGKDSLSSTYAYPDGTTLESPYNLVITVAGKIPDVEKTVSTDIKCAGSTLVLLGKQDLDAMGGSVYYDVCDGSSARVPEVDLNSFHQVCQKLHQAIQAGEVLAAHDVSEGGIAVAVSEMLFGGDCGAELTFMDENYFIDELLFNETAGCFVVEVDSPETAEKLFGNVPHQLIGTTTADKKLRVQHDGPRLPGIDVDELKRSWQRPLEEVLA